MNLAFHTFAIAPAEPEGHPFQIGPPGAGMTWEPAPVATVPELRARRVSRVDPVLRTLDSMDTTQKSVLAVHGAILLAVAYHGYARNRGSVGWGLVWSLGGFLCPTVTFGFAMTQGFAKPLPKED